MQNLHNQSLSHKISVEKENHTLVINPDRCNHCTEQTYPANPALKLKRMIIITI